MPKRVIVDFDNTLGVEGCDIDDGLALLFLLGDPGLVRVEGICTAYGNSDIATVNAATDRLVAAFGLDAPVHYGAASSADPVSDAARYLAETVAAEPGEIHVLATGSLTNLRGAALVDPEFFSNVASITCMGGLTETLLLNGKIMDELNLSCDPAATRACMESPAPMSIATAHNCLPSYFTREVLEGAVGRDSWLARTCAYWFGDMFDAYGQDGVVCWDVVAAAMLSRPDLFEDEIRLVTMNDRFLAAGYLEAANIGASAPYAVVHTPVIAAPEVFRREVLAAWARASIALGA